MALVRLFFSLAVLLKLALSVDHVPMLLWSTHSSLWNSEATLHEGHIISKQELHMLLQPVFTQDSKNLVLFLQDTLSIDDFTHYSESYENEKPFHNVQELLESSSSSLVLSAVDCQATSYLLDYLQESMDWKLTDIDEFEVSKLKVDTSKPNIFVVKLQPISRLNDISTAKAFAANEMLTAGLINDLLLLLFKSIAKFPLTSELVVSDPKFTKANKIIGRLTMSLQKQGIQFSVIYTAMRPSRIPRRPNVVLESRRRLLATEAQVTDAYYPLNVTNGTSTCILFYASNFSLTANKSVHADLTNLTFVSRKVDFSSSVCSDTNATLSLNYTGLVDGINNLKIRFLMTKKFYTGSARNWFTLDSVEIAHDNQMVARFNVSIISAPAEYSFHCQLVGTSSLYGAKLIPANSEAKNWDVYLSEFQIQGFNIHNNLFSYASDCTSFFSPGIWMGLVTSIVLLWILTYGIHMIMQLTTNSRFDDPKGQALSVPQTE